MLIQAPVAFAVTTNLLTGIGSISIKVPGTFSGFPPIDPTGARYFDHADIMSDSPGTNDYVDAISIEDTDGVIPVPARVAFAAYPTIVNFSSDTGVATSSKSGYYFNPEGHVKIGTIDGTLQIIPSGLYIIATIHGGLNKTYQINVVWGRYVNG